MNNKRNLLYLVMVCLLSILIACEPQRDVLEGMALIPAGEFRMGSIGAEADGDEQPLHRVYVDAFYIDKYEITVGEYKQFIKKTGHDAPDWDAIAKYSPTDEHPIANVTWYDAVAYAEWAGKRLPTEAEWEKAARGGLVGKKYSWGDTTPNGTQANLNGTEDGYEFTAPVGSFPANGYGLHDMAGNVQEWCLDAYQVTFYENSPKDNPIAGEVYMTDGTLSANIMISRVLRGGSYLNMSNKSGRVAGRSGSEFAAIGTNLTGFRCVKPINLDEEKVEPDTVKFVSVNPPSGITIQSDAILSITFDGPPGEIKANRGRITSSANNTVTITGPFRSKDLILKIDWMTGTHTLTYTVKIPEGAIAELQPEDMVLIPAGEFQMGSKDAEADNSEQPMHPVYVDAFYIDKHEVTIGQYRRFIRETGHHPLDWDNVFTYSPTDDHPVVGVSWHDAMAYAAWIGKRLPTEAEWEKATRGGNLISKKYVWGNTAPDAEKCNFGGSADGYEYAAPVGSFPANGYGLHDMAGNVWEWCLDEFQSNAYSNPPRKNPVVGESITYLISNSMDIKTERVLRGGSWFSTSHDVQVATRFKGSPSFRGSFVGFRCVKDVE
ncbi:formylglycine-generating enzyme family protein [Candidatus Poribacteria bacterium]|nr:formylglycine-generating enzyme family protein [Candidatus Poribacteria bacterium]